MQRSKTALVLAGGGVAGAAYEIGALCAIDQILDAQSVNSFDCYVGTSAGGLVAACLANNITPRALSSLLESSLLGIDQLEPQHLFALNPSHILQRAARLPAAVGQAARRIVGGDRLSVLDLFETLSASLPTGLYDTNTLERYLREALSMPGRTNSFADLPHELAIVATDLDNGERAVFGQPPLAAVPISQAVCASAAIPLFYRPVRVDGRDYIDGGIRGTASLDVAIERGAELIVCINPLVPYAQKSSGAISDEGIRGIGSQVFRTFIHAGLHYHIKQVRRRHPEVDIILIEPTPDDRTMFADSTMRYETRIAIARHGFVTVATHLNAHYDYYREMLARHGISISNTRLSHDLRAYEPRAARAGRAGNAPTHPSSAGLAHTLAELDRLISRLEQQPAS